MPADQSLDRERPALAVLGLSSAEEAAYRILIRRGAATIAEVEAAWPEGTSAESAGAAVERLHRRGLAFRRSEGPTTYAAVSPRAAFDPALADQGRRLREAREHAERLAHAYRSPAWTTGSDLVEVVTGRSAVRERLARALRSTRRELRSVVLGPAAGSDLVDAERELTGRGVATRVLYRADSGTDHLALPAAIRRWRPTHDAVPAPMNLIDQRLAVVLTEADGTTAIVIQPCELLTVLSGLFETLWERAGPPPRDTETDRLVDLLLSGRTDAGIGRALDVSPRTAQRRVAALLQAAGARTRFQAGVQAALRRR